MRDEILYHLCDILDNLSVLVEEGLCQLFGNHNRFDFNYNKDKDIWFYTCRYCGKKI